MATCDPCTQRSASGAILDWTARQTFYADGTAVNMCLSGQVWTTPPPARGLLPYPRLVPPDQIASLSPQDPGPWGACGAPIPTTGKNTGQSAVGVGVITQMSPPGACAIVVSDATTPAPLDIPALNVGQLQPEGPPAIEPPGTEPNVAGFGPADAALGLGIAVGAGLLTKAFLAWRRAR
jgi:hypothetical protein